MQLVPFRYQGDPGSALPPHAIWKGGQGAGKERENRSGANCHRARGSAPASGAPPPRLALAGPRRLQPGGLGSPPQGDLPAGGPTSQRSASAFAGSGAGALPLPPRACNPTPHLAAAAHPPPPLVRAWNRFAAQNPRAPRAELPRAGLRRAGEVAYLSLLLLPRWVQEQVSIPVLFGLHVVIGLLGIIMVHDGWCARARGWISSSTFSPGGGGCGLLPRRGEGVGTI